MKKILLTLIIFGGLFFFSQGASALTGCCYMSGVQDSSKCSTKEEGDCTAAGFTGFKPGTPCANVFPECENPDETRVCCVKNRTDSNVFGPGNCQDNLTISDCNNTFGSEAGKFDGQCSTYTECGGAGAGTESNAGAGVAGAIGQDPIWKGIVPCGRNYDDSGTTENETDRCTLCHLIVGIQRLFTYGLAIIIAVALAAFFIAGTMYMISTGDEEMMKKAKSFMISSVVGLTIVIAAWLIVNVSFWIIGVKSDLGVQKKSWFSFSCSTVANPFTDEASQ